MPPRNCDDEKWEVQNRINEKSETELRKLHDDVLTMKVQRAMFAIIGGLVGSTLVAVVGGLILWIIKGKTS